MKTLHVRRLGVRAYGESLALQRELAAKRISGEEPNDILLLVEHPPVITLGRSTKPGHLLASPAWLAERGVEMHEVERGGDVTFHGPGQLVGYPIIDLKQHRKDLHWYLRQVEECIIVALHAFGLHGERNPGLTGVWVGVPPVGNEATTAGSQVATGLVAAGSHPVGSNSATPPRKIASIGVHARDWVTWHGFALNVSTDLSWFDLMVPCGIADVRMTSIVAETGRPTTIEAAATAVAAAFETVFGFSEVVSTRRQAD